MPAPQSKWIEVICGKQTSPQSSQHAVKWAEHRGKETALVHKDMPGFVGNRIMYAMIRESLSSGEKQRYRIYAIRAICRR